MLSRKKAIEKHTAARAIYTIITAELCARYSRTTRHHAGHLFMYFYSFLSYSRGGECL